MRWSNFKKVLLLVAFATAIIPPVAQALTEEEISKQLKCQCGCGFPDLASCSCGEWAIPAKSEIRARLARGENLDTILKYFVARHGETVLTSPVQEGFNRAAWIVPSVFILVAGGLLSVVIYRWKKREETAMANEADEKPSISPANEPAKDDAYLNRLRDEIYGNDEES